MYKILLVVFILLIFILTSVGTAFADVYVQGYYRNNGTYVQPHYRSNPDGNPYNNWSYPGNSNPYTGEAAPGDSNTYLNNYYQNNGNGLGYGLSSGSSSLGSNSSLQQMINAQLEDIERYNEKVQEDIQNNFNNSLSTFANENALQKLIAVWPRKTGVGSINWMLTIPNRWTKEQIINLQQYLNSLGYQDPLGKPLATDGEYGYSTFLAHLAYFEDR